MALIYFVFYVLFCCAIGAAGKEQPLGFVGYALISFFLTPPVGLAVLLVMLLYTKAAAKQQVEGHATTQIGSDQIQK
ncbi:hypothetical protein [Algicola sagamiensis]|uniref:hypothetical protein n=1 Tax=Algicola sagamiensis TaxID=163869 RepID=UPI00035CCA88|nr:hypothetical protein [Algicola sagamiensis]